VNIAVCAKSVPTSSVTIEIDPNTKRVVREGVPKELDPAAASAVETGLRIVEAAGGEVTVVTMGPPGAVDDMRKALAMGAERGVLISDEALAGSDTLATAKALAAAIQMGQYDIVICATEATDTYSGLVPGQLAELLGYPPLTFANDVKVEGSKVTIHRQTEDGYQVVEGETPVLVTVTAGIAEPRYASLKGIMAPRSKEVKQLGLSDLGIEKGEPVETVLAVNDAEQRQAGEVVEDDGTVGVEKIMAILATAKVV